MTISTWLTEANIALARQRWDAGMSADAIAKEIGDGCTKGAVLGVRRRHQWPTRVGLPVEPALGYSPAQAAKVREMWTTDAPLALIRSTVNALGTTQLTEPQLRGIARRFNLHRPSLRGHKMSLRIGAAVTKRARVKGSPIPIPLREVYQRSAQLELPRTKRGNIHALNNAMKRAQPDHPGFVLADTQPTRLTWAL
jgi:hypothetical protein